MKIVSIREAKTHLSSLLEDVAKGNEVTIVKAGKPVARLVPVAERTGIRVLGYLRGRIRISDDFDAPLSDMQTAFEGDQSPKCLAETKPRDQPADTSKCREERV